MGRIPNLLFAQGRATLVQEQQRKDESLIKSNEKRALAAETSLELARRHLLDANSTIANLKEESLHQGETIASLRSTLVESANKGAHDADARVTTLEERLAALILENTELSNRADQLPNRYKDGKLVRVSVPQICLSSTNIYSHPECEREGIYTTYYGRCLSNPRRG